MNDDYENEVDAPDDLAPYIDGLIDACEKYSNEQKAVRDKSLEYYNLEMSDMKVEGNFTNIVSGDVRKTVKSVMPSIMRTLFSNNKIVEFHPTGPGKEDMANQATDYINYVLVGESDIEDSLHDAIFDALVLKTGILEWSAYSRKKVTIHSYTNQSEEALYGLTDEPGVEVVDIQEVDQVDPNLLAMNPDARLFNFKIKRTVDDVDIKLEAVPRGSFLIHPGYGSIKESPIVGKRELLTRSELVSRGFDRDVVAGLSCFEGDDDEYDDSHARQGDDWSDIKSKMRSASQNVLVYTVYVDLDLDEDGINEIYKVCLGEGEVEEGEGSNKVILSIEPVDEKPFAKVVCEREAHEFEGRSLAEDVISSQKVKTALLREAVDNVTWQNKLQLIINETSLTEDGLEALAEPEFGRHITYKGSMPSNTIAQPLNIPFIADKAFAIKEKIDLEDRQVTGISENSSGIDPQSFQNMSATSARIMADNSLAQAEMLIRTITRGGIEEAFRGLLRLVVAHSDKVRTIYLRNEWHEYNPATWDADMSCTVNIGLGAGSRERDLSVLHMVYGMQKEVMQTLGINNPFVGPQQVYNTIEKIIEAAGLPDSTPFILGPTQEGIQAMQQQLSQPSPEQIKMEQEAQLEQVKAQARVQVEQAQMEADMRVKQAEMNLNAELELVKSNQARELALLKGELDLLKHREELEFKYAKEGMNALTSMNPITTGTIIKEE